MKALDCLFALFRMKNKEAALPWNGRNMETLHKQLNQAGYICNTRFASAIHACLNTKPVAGGLFFGPIGTGKTYLPEVLSRIMEAEYFFYQCFPGTREDDLMVKMLPDESTISGIALHQGVLLQAMAATRTVSGGRKVILVLDEWDKTRPSADSFLLDFLQTGRIVFAGQTHTADLDRLVVFLTLNVERELSEPLLRRLPKVDFQHLTPSMVHKALKISHPDHPYLNSAVILYERCLAAELPKPATIQELRQLLDAITVLGTGADWDSLVYQFVTKTEEGHELLRRAEKERSRWRQQYRPRIDAEAYNAKGRYPLETVTGETLEMPGLAQSRGFDDIIATPDSAPDSSIDPIPEPANIHAVVELNHASYNAVVKLLDAPGDRPDRLGDFAEVHGNYLLFIKPMPLSAEGMLKDLWGEVGEVVFTEPKAQWEDVKALQTWAAIKVVKFSKDEILAKAEGIDLRWTPETGAEIVVDLGYRHAFQHCFGEGWGRVGEARWIGRDGLIYRRYHPEETTLQADGSMRKTGLR
jgi:hypothetical protein